MNYKFVKYRIAVANCDHRRCIKKASDIFSSPYGLKRFKFT